MATRKRAATKKQPEKAPARARSRAKPKQAPQAKATVTTKKVASRRVLSEDQQVQEFATQVFETDPAYVRVNQGMTKNLGEYESLRIDVSISLPCYPEMVDDTVADAGKKAYVLLAREAEAWGVEIMQDDDAEADEDTNEEEYDDEDYDEDGDSDVDDEEYDDDEDAEDDDGEYDDEDGDYEDDDDEDYDEDDDEDDDWDEDED